VDNFLGAVLPVVAARLHRMTDRGVECAAAFFRDHQGKLHGLVKNGAGGHRRSGVRGKLHQLALRIEPGAALFNFVKPSKRAIHGCLGAGADDADGHEGSHDGFRARDHFALPSASTIA